MQAREEEYGPRVPDEIIADMLDPAARAELKTLPGDLADSVARHLVAAGLAEDPELAYRHAQAARRLAARVGIVREATGIAAYQAEHWSEAIAELRAARRLTGRNIGLPLMADSERALGRLDRALALVHEPQARNLDRATQIELVIVESGIRRDQGMPEAALLALRVPELTSGRSYPWSARLFYAYADALADLGRMDEARDWFARAAAADPDGETGAALRYEELDDVTFEDLQDSGAEDSDLENPASDDSDAEDSDPEDSDPEDSEERSQPEPDPTPEDSAAQDPAPEDSAAQDPAPEDSAAQDSAAQDSTAEGRTVADPGE